jgi:hypothetical protein
MYSRPGRLCLVLLVVLMAALPRAGSKEQPPPAPAKPKLVVLVVFDQFRGDYPQRWKDLYGEGGFQRLMKEGTWFSNCHYPYGITVTGAGHATLATGCEPYRHGIIENEWYDRETRALVYCAKMPQHRKVGAPPVKEPESKGENKITGYGSPERLLVPTLADAWKDKFADKAKVVSLSLKDRGCVFTGGRKPDACYWFDDKTGAFVTSTYYAGHVAPWVVEFNAPKPADAWFGKDWTRFRSDLDYQKCSGPDDQIGESNVEKLGRVFPHPLTGGLEKPGAKYYTALYTTPFANDLLLQFVKKAIVAEQLGQHEAPDLLCVSFSATDSVGHCWGPDSQEVLDTALRADAVLAEFLRYLDEKVGKGQYLLALSADHGVCPLPEISQQKGLPAVRMQPTELQKRAEEFLQEKFGPMSRGKYILEVSWPMIYLNHRALADRGLASEVEIALVGWLKQQKGILKAYTHHQLAARLPGGDGLGAALQKSFHPERSGDILILLQQYSYCSKYLTGTGHGTPHPYDTHVPLMVFGTGVKAEGQRQDRITPLAVPKILGYAVGVELPHATVEVPSGLFVPVAP